MGFRRCVAAVMLAAGLGQAQAACWADRNVENAQIRQFDILLMVSALRCQVRGVDFVTDYNAFVIRNRPILVGANDEILKHFNSELGGKAALGAYDRMSTGMANQFGNGGGFDDCEALRVMVRSATPVDTPATRDALLGQAQRSGMDPLLPGARCAIAAAPAPAVPVSSAAGIAPLAVAATVTGPIQ